MAGGGGGLSQAGTSAKTFGQLHYKIVPFPDTWDELFEIQSNVMVRLESTRQA